MRAGGVKLRVQQGCDGRCHSPGSAHAAETFFGLLLALALKPLITAAALQQLQCHAGGGIQGAGLSWDALSTKHSGAEQASLGLGKAAGELGPGAGHLQHRFR